MAKDEIGVWFDENLRPIFANMLDALTIDKADIFFRFIVISFSKNTIALLENAKMHLGSYPIAQEMRLLMELEADTDFLVKNPENIPRLKKKTDKCRADYVSKKKTWHESIVASGNMHLLDGATGADISTKERVERVFDKELYSFYCAYSHFNMYAICDDAENVSSFEAANLKKANIQKAELIMYYPVILDKFIKTINIILSKDNQVTCDPAKTIGAFKQLLVALCKAKIRSQDV